jgi:hypothetical protein
MRLSNLGGVGITGIVAVFTGLFLLWHHRSDILGWFTAYIFRLRSELARRDALADRLGGTDETRASNVLLVQWPHGALAIVAGICLIVGGQLALYVDLLS